MKLLYGKADVIKLLRFTILNKYVLKIDFTNNESA